MSKEESSGGLPFTIWMVAIPIFLDMVMSFSMFFIDSYFLSTISTTAAASVGSIIPIYVIFVLLFMMIAQGGANVAGHQLGAKLKDKVNLTYSGTLYLNAVIGLGVFLFLFILGPDLVSLFGFGEQGEFYAGEYLKYISIALWIFGIKTALSVVCLSHGKTHYNLYSGIIVNILNITLNALFVFVFDMGVYGVVLATIISQTMAALYYLFIVVSRFKVVFVFSEMLKQRSTVLGPILAIGLPASIQPISAEAGMFVLSLIAVSIGEEAMAARVFVMNLLTLAICWSSALSIGNQIIVSHLYGARQYQLLGKKVDEHIRYAMAGSMIIMLILVAASQPLLGIFTSSSQIISSGVVLLILGLVIEPVRSHAMIVSYSLKATGDAAFPAIIGVISTWLIAVPVGYLLGVEMGIGVAGLWIALLIDEVIRAGINNARWLSGKWQATDMAHLRTEPQEA